jgi:hypothetical protein
MQGKTDLLEIGDTRNLPGPLLRLGQRRQQHCRKDRDDGDDHQQFDQSETSFPTTLHFKVGNEIQILFYGFYLRSEPTNPANIHKPQKRSSMHESHHFLWTLQ